MERKLLLFFVMFMCSLGTWAANIEMVDGISGQTDRSSGHKVQTMVVSTPGALAEWVQYLNDHSEYNSGFGASTDFYSLKISGKLNQADIQAISSAKVSGFASFPRIDMGDVTFDEDASEDDLKSITSSAEYMELPHGTSIAVMKAMQNNNPSLKAVAATDAAEPTEFTGYSWAAGEIWNICQQGIIDGISEGVCANTMTKLTIGGNVDDRDTNTYDAAESGNHEKSDFKGGKAYYFTNDVSKQTQNEYLAPSHTSPGSPWVGGTEISLDFSEAVFANKGDLALVSNNTVELKLPTESSFTKIYPSMFYGLEKLKKIEIPNNIVTIGDAAFFVNNGNSQLEEIYIGNGIKTIGNSAFAATGTGRAKLTDVKFAAGISDVKILSSTFTGCNAIKHLTLPEGIYSIGEQCFNQLTSLESVHFPTTLQYIGRKCFNQTGLTSLTIPSSVKVIDYNAFSLCRITDIYLMAETLDQLPFIFAADYARTSTSSTFDSNMLHGNNTTSPTSRHDAFLTMSSDAAEEQFRLDVKDGNTITRLHYNDALADFIDLNPWYFEGKVTPKPYSNAINGNGGINEAKSLSATYYLVDKDGNTYPAADASDLARASVTAYYKTESHTWDAEGNDTDYPKTDASQHQTKYYDPTTGELVAFTEATDYMFNVLRKEGWRQFIFKTGDAGSEDVVFNKEYYNVWYTMCFPFSLTDEQLETAFNADYNIADFSGVEIITSEEDDSKSIVMHFNSIAKAKYFDLENNEYKRVDGSKTVQEMNGSKFNVYTYEKDGDQYTYVKTFSNKSYAKNGDTSNGIVYIDGYLAVAGHPYMIHPNFGTSKGDKAVTAHMTGINYYSKEDAVINQLCKDRARSIDLGTGKGYVGITMSEADASDIAVNTSGVKTENFDQKAYKGYDGQTYSFVGNCIDYRAGVPAKPVITTYVDAKYLPNGPVKAEQGAEPTEPAFTRPTEADKPTEVENPEENSKYTSDFKTLYNTVRCENVYLGYIDGQNRYADITFGEDLVNYDMGEFFWNYGTYEYANRSAAHNANGINTSALEAYLGAATQSDIVDKFNALKQLATDYANDITAYAAYFDALDEYNAAVAAWEAYDAAKKAYDEYTDEKAEEEFEAAKKEYAQQLKNYENAVSEWEVSASSYAVLIPKNAYFLSRKSNEYYTHFFREIASMTGRQAGHGMWSKYTAVLIPNTAAINGIEAGVEPEVSEGAKAVELAFDEAYSDYYDATAIQEVLDEAREQGVKVEYMDVVISIDGKVVRRGDTSLEGLPRGLYIVNGKKYFVK